MSDLTIHVITIIAALVVLVILAFLNNSNDDDSDDEPDLYLEKKITKDHSKRKKHDLKAFTSVFSQFTLMERINKIEIFVQTLERKSRLFLNYLIRSTKQSLR